MPPTQPTRWIPDTVAAVALFAVVVGYLVPLPLNLQAADEARYLDHAKRLLDGEVLYRDVFDISAPGWVFLMTGAFALFGTTLAVARGVIAVIHGATAVAVFAICRGLGIRRELAWACAFAAVIVTQRLCPGATYHWLATFLSVVVFLLCVLPTRAPRWTFVTGIVLGLLIAVHQQRGAAFSVGVGVWLVAQWALDRLQGTGRALGDLWTQLVALAGGVAIVMVPLLVALAAWAGIDPLWECLVTVPLVNYHGALRTSWGNAWGATSPLIVLMQAAPFVLIPIAAIAIVLCRRRRAPEAARQYVLLTIIGATALLSVAYFPDIVHLTLIAPVFLIMVADLVERGLERLSVQTSRTVGAAIALAVLVAVGIGAYQRAVELHDKFRVPYDSAFGRIDLGVELGGINAAERQIRYYDQLRAVLDETPGRLLYVHPRASYTHLLVDARNPTRYDLVWAPVYTSREQMQELIATLRDKQVPYIVWSPLLTPPRPEDLVTQFILQHYESMSEPKPLSDSLWKLKTAPQDANGS